MVTHVETRSKIVTSDLNFKIFVLLMIYLLI